MHAFSIRESENVSKFGYLYRALVTIVKPTKNRQIVNYIMYLTSEKKAELFAKYGKDAKNTGSAESQIALFTFRINHLTDHLKENRKDFGTERALTALVGKRRRMLDYLKAKDIERYRAIIKELNIRK